MKGKRIEDEMYWDIVERVEAYCSDREILRDELGIVVGLSGGADSVFLLQVLKELQHRYRLRLCAVHVNHGIRGREALRDEEFARDYAGKLGIPFRKFAGDVPEMASEWHMSEEEAGREFRYRCFEKVREQLGYDVIAVAHHRDDQAETILFQMLRGSGLRGMGGMRAWRDRVIRPLLCVGKKEILQALKEKGTGFCEDSTNGETRYRRNKIRREILPLLQEVQEGAVEHLVRLGEEMQDIMAYLEQQTEACCREMVREEDGCLKVEVSAFLAIPDVLQRELLMRILGQMAGNRRDIGSVHVAQFQGLFAGETGKQLDFPYGMQAWREYGYVYLGKQIERRESDGEELPGELLLGKEVAVTDSRGEKWVLRPEKEAAERLSAINLKKYCTKCFDYDKMDTMPRFRYWEPGDFLWLDRKGHRKKLGRIFVDEKIPAKYRKRIPILAEGSHVLWIPELDRQSAYFYVTKQTREVLCIYQVRE